MNRRGLVGLGVLGAAVLLLLASNPASAEHEAGTKWVLVGMDNNIHGIDGGGPYDQDPPGPIYCQGTKTREIETTFITYHYDRECRTSPDEAWDQTHNWNTDVTLELPPETIYPGHEYELALSGSSTYSQGRPSNSIGPGHFDAWWAHNPDCSTDGVQHRAGGFIYVAIGAPEYDDGVRSKAEGDTVVLSDEHWDPEAEEQYICWGYESWQNRFTYRGDANELAPDAPEDDGEDTDASTADEAERETDQTSESSSEEDATTRALARERVARFQEPEAIDRVGTITLSEGGCADPVPSGQPSRENLLILDEDGARRAFDGDAPPRLRDGTVYYWPSDQSASMVGSIYACGEPPEEGGFEDWVEVFVEGFVVRPGTAFQVSTGTDDAGNPVVRHILYAGTVEKTVRLNAAIREAQDEQRNSELATTLRGLVSEAWTEDAHVRADGTIFSVAVADDGTVVVETEEGEVVFEDRQGQGETTVPAGTLATMRPGEAPSDPVQTQSTNDGADSPASADGGDGQGDGDDGDGGDKKTWFVIAATAAALVGIHWFRGRQPPGYQDAYQQPGAGYQGHGSQPPPPQPPQQPPHGPPPPGSGPPPGGGHP